MTKIFKYYIAGSFFLANIVASLIATADDPAPSVYCLTIAEDAYITCDEFLASNSFPSEDSEGCPKCVRSPYNGGYRYDCPSGTVQQFDVEEDNLEESLQNWVPASSSQQGYIWDIAVYNELDCGERWNCTSFQFGCEAPGDGSWPKCSKYQENDITLRAKKVTDQRCTGIGGG